MKILLLTLALASLALGACKHRNKIATDTAKNPVMYPTAKPVGTYNVGYGYVK
ncbi:MAG: hypothetical protein AAF733_05010 [Verrucomicrobiota bacterium]